VLAHPSMLGDLQTIGLLGVVLHSWESISRGATQDLLCNGRKWRARGSRGEGLEALAMARQSASAVVCPQPGTAALTDAAPE
jgi:hypothetical protein